MSFVHQVPHMIEKLKPDKFLKILKKQKNRRI